MTLLAAAASGVTTTSTTGTTTTTTTAGGPKQGVRSLTLAQTVNAAPVLRTVTTGAGPLISGGTSYAPSAVARQLGTTGITDWEFRLCEAHSWEATITGGAVSFRVDMGAGKSPTTETALRVYVDGSPVADDGVDGFTPTTQISEYRVDLPTTGAHTVRVDLSQMHCTNIIVNAGGTVTPTARRVRGYMLGDSWVRGASYRQTGLVDNGPQIEQMAFLTGRLLDVDFWTGGRDGTGYYTQAGWSVNYSGTPRVDRIVAADVDFLVVFGSINDTLPTKPELGTYATALFNRIAADLPGVPIIVIGEQDYGQNYTRGADAQPPLTSAVAAATNVVAYHQPLVENWVAVGGSGINNPVNGGHLSANGNSWYAEKMAPLIHAALVPTSVPTLP